MMASVSIWNKASPLGFYWTLFLGLAVALGGAAAGEVPGSGKEVLVVYNSRVPESREVARYYAQKRKVPSEQVVGLPFQETETISRQDYRVLMEEPLLRFLEDNRLFTYHLDSSQATNDSGKTWWKVSAAKIRFAVLCYGVPYRISRDLTLHEEGIEKLPAELRHNEAAVDTELALLPLHDLKLPLSGPVKNPFFSVTNSSLMSPTNGLLMVTRLDGPTAAIAKGLVDKALLAEEKGLWGRGYFDARGLTNGDYKIGDDWIRQAAENCQKLGIESFLDEKPETLPASFPASHIAFYAGWYDANLCGPFARQTVEFMPGAFAYHLHSYSAVNLRSTGTSWVGPLLAKGATISMGCVEEPYLRGTPDLGMFIARFIYLGFTFAEAAYASQLSLSWQLTIVGDPLYRPFGKKPEVLHRELETSGDPLIVWSHLKVVELNLVKGFPVADVAAYLEGLKLTRRSAVLLEKLSAIYELQGKPNSSIDALEKGLKQNPSPQQRVRMSLALVEKLLTAGEEKKALNALETFRNDCSDYPELPAVQARMTALARKLNDPRAERWERSGWTENGQPANQPSLKSPKKRAR